MRITCKVNVQNRLLPALNMSPMSRSSQSSLAIGCHSGVEKDLSNLFLHVCTIQNKQGTTYKINDNIEAVFSKFANEGKFTIRLKDPQHDLCIVCEPLKAKYFLKILNHALCNRSVKDLPLSNLNAVKTKHILKTRLTILSRKDYPLREGFSQTLTFLRISGIDLSRIEKRISNLRKLQVLDLSHNSLAEVPTEVFQMPSLKELILAHNNISSLDKKSFEQCTKNTLTNLVLSHNKLTSIPYSIKNMTSLIMLQVDHNNLSYLSPWIGRLQNLRELNASQNSLEDLPASVFSLSLQSLDISGNPFGKPFTIVKNSFKKGPLTLLERAALACIKLRLQCQPSDVPASLCLYLESHFGCLCGNPVLESHILGRVPLGIRRISQSCISDQDRLCVPCLVAFCSDKCCRRFFRS